MPAPFDPSAPPAAPSPAFSASAAAIARTAWGAILWLTVVLFAGGLMRMAFGPLQEAVKLDMGLSDFQISLVQGIATGLPVGLFSLPVAWMTDHGHRIRLLAGLIAICAIGTLWTGFSSGFNALFVARMLASLGVACALTVVVSLCADLCPADSRGRALVVVALGAVAGTAAGYVLGGSLFTYLQQHPLNLFGARPAWREIHILIGIGGLLLVPPLLAMREPARHEVATTDTALSANLRALWGRRAFLFPLFAGHLGVSMADTAATIWAAPVLIRDFHLAPGEFAGWMGGVIMVGGVLGAVIGGLGADWGQKTGRRGGILYAALIAVCIGIPTSLYPLMPTVAGFALMLCLLLLAGTTINLVATTAITVLIPNEERGVCMASFGIINSVVGLSLAPTLVTVASSAMGGEQHLGASLAITGFVTGVLSLIGYVFAYRNAPLPAVASR
ncbi:MFS transporter [Hydrocarboniphaga sp.]|uniref:MFS transporter n=1 Tax=Hydrocarboniphaga sp. TaxID=2033016 RepID=UPI003D09D965